MNLDPQNLGIGWFDFVVGAVLIIGMLRGRKRGMSEEMLDLVQALLMVYLAGTFYTPLGDYIRTFTGFPLLVVYVGTYVGIIVSVKIVFVLIKRMAGEKLVGSDLFGPLEYYLGMIAGMVRWSCMLFIVISLVHAPGITDAEYEQKEKEHLELYGSNYFRLFQLGYHQRAVFKFSATGPIIEKYAGKYLIAATPMGDIMDRTQGIGRKQEEDVRKAMGGK